MDFALLSRLIENLIRLGTVYEVDHAQKRCRVQTGALLTGWLPWVSNRAGQTKDWDPPNNGEQCIIFSPSGELAAGVVMVGIYSSVNDSPSTNPDEKVRTYPDGARISYNHVTGALNAVGIKSALVEASETIVFDCPDITCTGKFTVQGLFTYQNGMVGTGGENSAAIITGDVIANNISLVTHTHPGDSGGTTGQPNG